MRARFASMILASAAVASSGAGSALAQPKEDITRAEGLFEEGKTLLKAGNDADACARFAESKQLAPAVGVSLYLADCLQRIGKTASAWAEFRSAAALARERNDKRADLAQHRALALAPTLDRVTIVVSPALAQGPLRVARDGKAVPPEEWGLAVAVDPGDHLIVARSGRMLRAFEAHVDANGPTAVVHIDELYGEDTPARAVPAPNEAGDASTKPPSETPGPAPSNFDTKRLLISLGLAGVGAVGIGVGLGFGIMAKSDRDQSNAGPCNAADQCSANGLSLRHNAINEALVSTIAFGAGLAALGACAIVAFVIPHGTTSTGVIVAPAPVAGGGGAIVQGGF
jgi:hypothetical protein